MKLLTLSLATLVTLPATAAGPAKPPSHRAPALNAAVLYLSNDSTLKTAKDLEAMAARLKGSKIRKASNGSPIWDLNGGILDGINQSGDGGQSEDQEPLIRVKMPLIIANGFIRNNKDALSFRSPDSGVVGVTWLNVGEDAVSTTDGAHRMLIENCEFINKKDGDKSIQLNEAKDAIVRNNLIFYGITCIRVGDDQTTEVSDRAEISGNRFHTCDTAVNASKITVTMSNNQFKSVKTKQKTSNGAVFE